MAGYRSPFRDFVKFMVTRVGGQKLYMKLQTKAMIQNLDRRLVDEPETNLIEEFVQDGDTVIDVGANYFYYTAIFAQQSPTGKVYAFEPIPFTYQVAERMRKHYDYKQVELYQKGVGNTNERVHFQVPKQKGGGVAAGLAHIGTRDNNLVKDQAVYEYRFTEHEEIPCDIVKLDDFLLFKLQQDEVVSLVKVDIEGAELFALKGMQELLTRYQPVILIEIVEAYLQGFDVSSQQIIQFLNGLGYSLYRYNAQLHKLEHVTTCDVESNYLAIHQKFRTRLTQYLPD